MLRPWSDQFMRQSVPQPDDQHSGATPSCTFLGLLQGTVEGKIRDAQRDLFQKTLCQAYATLDRWVEKSMADVRAMETEVSHPVAACCCLWRVFWFAALWSVNRLHDSHPSSNSPRRHVSCRLPASLRLSCCGCEPRARPRRWQTMVTGSRARAALPLLLRQQPIVPTELLLVALALAGNERDSQLPIVCCNCFRVEPDERPLTASAWPLIVEQQPIGKCKHRVGYVFVCLFVNMLVLGPVGACSTASSFSAPQG